MIKKILSWFKPKKEKVIIPVKQFTSQKAPFNNVLNLNNSERGVYSLNRNSPPRLSKDMYYWNPTGVSSYIGAWVETDKAFKERLLKRSEK